LFWIGLVNWCNFEMGVLVVYGVKVLENGEWRHI
jgi:hypothetical protein